MTIKKLLMTKILYQVPIIKLIFVTFLITFCTFLSIGCESRDNTFEVDFLVDGKIYKIAMVNENEYIKSEDLVEVQKDGFVFLGWFIGDEKYVDNNIVTSDLVLTAKFERITHQVKIVYNEDDILELKVNDGDSLSLSDHIKDIDGYAFIRWEIDSEVVTNDIVITNNVTINAVYDLSYFDVAIEYFDKYNKEISTQEKISIKYNDIMNLNDYLKEINDYTFVGWFISENEVEDEIVINSNKIVKGIYQKEEFTVSFIFNDKDTDEYTFEKGTEINLDDYSKEYDGYLFKRWIVNDMVISSNILIITQNTVVKAQYSVDPKVNFPNDFKNHGKISVLGKDLVDKDSNKFQLIGLSTHGLQWFGRYVNYNTFAALKKEFGINVIRLSMYTSENGYCDGSDYVKKQLYNTVVNGINYATQLDMYAIVDWHMVGAEDLNDKNPLYYKDEAVDFFSRISNQFKDNTNILYEIMNEPCGTTTWKDCKEYANAVIPVIRANTDAIVLVGSPKWSTDLSSIQKDPLIEYSNIMYTYHFYANDIKLATALEDGYANGLPIFVSEHGGMDASGDGDINVTSINNWYKMLDSLNISYVAWNISNSAGSASIIKHNNSTLNDFSDSNLKEWGIFYKNHTKSKIYK